MAKFYQMYDFDFEVKGGKAEFAWTKTLAAFGLLIAPGRGRIPEGRGRRRDRAPRGRRGKDHTPQPPKEPFRPTGSRRERGFVIWSRNYLKDVGLYDRPTDAERGPKVLKVKAACGERAHVAFTVTPLKDLGSITSRSRDLAGRHRRQDPVFGGPGEGA